MRYSFNLNREPFVFSHGYDINASYKDLSAVCDAIRYLKVNSALELLDGIMEMNMPIPYRRHNKYMGSRHELKGAKGAFPVKAAREVRKVLVNAVANSSNKGMYSDDMCVVHAAANKTHIEQRRPSKGALSWGRGRYGMSAATHSNLEYAKVEIGLGRGDEEELTSNMKYFIKVKNKRGVVPKKEKAVKKEQAKAKEPAKKGK